MIHDIQVMAIPDIHGDSDTPIGHISYDLTSIHVNGVNIPTSAILASVSGLTVSLSGASISMTANWYVLFHHSHHSLF